VDRDLAGERKIHVHPSSARSSSGVPGQHRVSGGQSQFPRPQYEIAFERGDAAACLFQVFVIELFGIALGGFDLCLLPATPRRFAFTQFSSERNGDDCEGDFSPGG
jgi:hypothetical protein